MVNGVVGGELVEHPGRTRWMGVASTPWVYLDDVLEFAFVVAQHLHQEGSSVFSATRGSRVAPFRDVAVDGCVRLHVEVGGLGVDLRHVLRRQEVGVREVGADHDEQVGVVHRLRSPP